MGLFVEDQGPPRVLAIAWLALHESIVTMDNLRKRKVIVINACSMCLRDEKSVNHLLLNCRVGWKVWCSLIRGFGYSWIPPRSIVDFFVGWQSFAGSKKGKMMWSLPFVAVIWALWKEKRRRCFEGKSSSSDVIAAKARISVAVWASILPNFWGVSIESISRNWRDVAIS